MNLAHGFFSHAEAAQTLRRASLVLQLSGGVEALTARHTVHGDEPMVVRLAKGAAHDVVVERLRRLFAALHQGSVLDLAAATCVLLLTAADLVVRFNVFLRYPFKLCFMCRVWFPATWCQNISEFLHEARENLDVGVGIVLQQLAWAQGTEVLALGWLSSAPIQGFLQQLGEEALSTSLDVERQLGQVKQWEMSKSTNIATASRNMIVVRFANNREKLVAKVAAATRRLQRAMRLKCTSMAWKADPQAAPVGKRWTADYQPTRTANAIGARASPPKKQRRAHAMARGTE